MKVNGHIQFPIRYKFLAVTTLLLVFSVTAYLMLASRIFRRDKVELVFDLNRNAVTTLASDFGTRLTGIADKMKIAAILSQAETSGASKRLLDNILNSESGIVFLSASDAFKSLDRVYFTDSNFNETYAIDREFYLNGLPKARPIPFAEIQKSGIAIWNATIEGGPPLLGLGRSVVTESADRGATHAPFAMVAFVRADKFLRAFSETRLNETIAVNRNGEILIHPDAAPLVKGGRLDTHPLFSLAKSQNLPAGVSTFQKGEHEYLGAYATTHDGQVMVLSQVDSEQAFAAVSNLVRRSLIFASIAITLAFLAAVFFSRSLTRPLQALSEAMVRVSEGGELNAAQIDATSRDEIALLAVSFNRMLDDLQTSRQNLEDVNRGLETKVKDRTRRLEEQNRAVKKAQEALLQSTRLATVGEVAGRAAHEVLNPLTSLVARIERVRGRLQGEITNEVQFMREIVSAWESDVSAGGIDKLIENWRAPSAIDPVMSLIEEDLGNVKRTETVLREQITQLMTDMDFILRESQRINKIVQNMRSLTRTRSEEKDVSLKQLLGQAVRIMADLGDSNNVQFIELYSSEDDHVRLDPDEFIQCATNLLRNSIQAIQSRRQTDGSGGMITIETRVRDGVVECDLHDDGVGIQAEHQAQLFEIQFSTKPASEGTGLGLTITRRFIRSFGGDVELVRSAPLKGCVFRIRLPIANESFAATGKVAV